MDIRIGLHSCGWGDRPLPDVLIAAHELGYDGVELAPAWLRRSYEMDDVDAMLREHGVMTTPTVFAGSGNYCDPAAVPGAVETATWFCRWIRERDGENVIFTPVAGRYGLRTDEERRNVHRAYAAVGVAVRSEGCVPLYHNHYVVSHEVSRKVLLEDLEDMDWDTWQLCLDTGHLVLALQDPVVVFEEWSDTVAWVHCKDVRTAVFAQIDTPRPFRELHPLFTEAGQGVVDFPAILKAVFEANCPGWLVVEQDHTDKTPYEAAEVSHGYLRQVLRGRENG